MYYKPSCVEGVLTCKDICGRKCTRECLIPHTDCDRGKLDEKFMYCPMMENIDSPLPYVPYELQADKTVKEGKQAYKKMEKVVEEIPIDDFVEKFKEEFHDYSKHEVESWYLNAVRGAAFSPGYMPDHVIGQVMDFGQNLVHDKRHAISEEYFHKAQSALHVCVTTICTPSGTGEIAEKHTITQITASDNK